MPHSANRERSSFGNCHGCDDVTAIIDSQSGANERSFIANLRGYRNGGGSAGPSRPTGR